MQPNFFFLLLLLIVFHVCHLIPQLCDSDIVELKFCYYQQIHIWLGLVKEKMTKNLKKKLQWKQEREKRRKAILITVKDKA